MASRFEERLWGPQGWTRPLTDALGSHILGYDDGGAREFAGVPAELSTHIADQLITTGSLSIDGFSPWKVSDAIGILGGNVTFCGYCVNEDRLDERIEFSAAQLDVTGWYTPRAELLRYTAMCEGFITRTYQSGYGTRLTLYATEPGV